MYLIVVSCIILILVFLLIEVVFYNRFQLVNIRIEEAENSIDILLQKKFQLLERTVKIITEANQKYIEEGVLENLVKIKNKKISNFDLNQELEKALAEYRGLIDLDHTLREMNTLNRINLDLVEVDNDLTAAKKYYNEHIVAYNKLIRCLPSNLVARILHYHTKEFYSEEKVEVLEILKEK